MLTENMPIENMPIENIPIEKLPAANTPAAKFPAAKYPKAKSPVDAAPYPFTYSTIPVTSSTNATIKIHSFFIFLIFDYYYGSNLLIIKLQIKY